MKKHKILILMILAMAFSGKLVAASDKPGRVAVVNFTKCITDSKPGKHEQENLEYMRKQMASMMEESEKELKNISEKFSDADYMDSLSPKAEEELKIKYQTLSEELGRYQQQYYQVSNQASYQLMQKMNSIISKASEKIAKRKNLAYVVNKEACFYFTPDLEITNQVIEEMDHDFEFEQGKKKAVENKSSK